MLRIFDNFPVRGARQTSSARDYWQDGWVGPYLFVNLQAQTSIQVVKVEGWRPDSSPVCELNFSIGNSFHKIQVNGGLFELSIPAKLFKGDYFEFSIRSSESFKPENDDRRLAFVARQIEFVKA